MLEFLQDKETYEDRKVDRWDSGDKTKMVSTAAVSDGRKLFETAVKHPAYDDGKMIIVGCYDTKAEAQVGHDKWLDLMLTNKLPKVLSDCGNAKISQLIDLLDGVMEFERDENIVDAVEG